MPLPQIVAPASTGAVGRHVFVSYSHLDAELAEPFMRTLYALAGNLPELGLAPERIFYDRAKLKAGDDWDDSIKSHLQRADIFLFLVSSNSLTSRYCLKEELTGAASLGIAIVPVLLSPTPMWENRPVEGDARNRRLGAFNAVPINGKAGPQPIRGGNWATRDQALAQAAQQIAARLQRDDAPLSPTTAHAPQSTRRALPPLLPNLCNQQQPEDSFENGLDLWTPEKALLVLVKGEFVDDAPGFWERLCHKNLAGFCEVASQALRPARPLELPSAFDGAQLQADLLPAVRRKLSEALFGNSRRMRSGADLAALLATDDAVQPLWATLPSEAAEGSAAVLQALLALLDEAPAGAPLGRLVIAVLVENPALVADDQLALTLALRATRTHVVEARRLQPLKRDDVKRWHRQHQLQDTLALDEEQLVERLFKQGELLRHRPFDQLVRPLLGLSAKEPE